MDLKLSSGLFTVDQLSEDVVNEIVSRGNFYKKRFVRGGDKKVGGLNGLRMVNMFFEPSTRTRISFETAAKSMGMLVSNIIADASAMTKGETPVDTMLTINAMSFDVIIMRVSHNNMPYDMSRYSEAAIINAGDGTNEHPTQALLDLFTIKDRAPDAKVVAIVGNLAHSRVARSNAKLLAKMGYKVMLCGPEAWLPDLSSWNLVDADGTPMVSATTNLSDVLDNADVIMTLRIQTERFSDIHRGLIDLKSYNDQYGIKASRVKPSQLVMHPGPVNRGVEIDEDILYASNSAILDQVGNGVAVRSAILEQVLRP